MQFSRYSVGTIPWVLGEKRIHLSIRRRAAPVSILSNTHSFQIIPLWRFVFSVEWFGFSTHLCNRELDHAKAVSCLLAECDYFVSPALKINRWNNFFQETKATLLECLYDQKQYHLWIVWALSPISISSNTPTYAVPTILRKKTGLFQCSSWPYLAAVRIALYKLQSVRRAIPRIRAPPTRDRHRPPPTPHNAWVANKDTRGARGKRGKKKEKRGLPLVCPSATSSLRRASSKRHGARRTAL